LTNVKKKVAYEVTAIFNDIILLHGVFNLKRLFLYMRYLTVKWKIGNWNSENCLGFFWSAAIENFMRYFIASILDNTILHEIFYCHISEKA
jgi:hypothetical protein